MLCPLCQSLNLSTLLPLEITYDDEDVRTADINVSDGFRHHPSFPSLLISSENGCILCALVARVLQEKQKWSNHVTLYGSILGESEDALVARLVTESSGALYLFSVEGTEKRDGAGIWEMGVVATFDYGEGNDDGVGGGQEGKVGRVDAFSWRALEVWGENGTRIAGLKGYANYRTITPSPLSDHATGVSKGWFESCQSSHPVCQTHKLYILPSRVIDVRDPCRPRLHLAKGESGQWAALSHCWGNSVTKTLTTASIDEMEDAISLASLPQNFRDAITITRLMGIPFLWIDSLCIVQDSTEDWREESVRMGDIYKNSAITIAATNAERSSDGFLRDRQPEARCALKFAEGEEVSVIVRPSIEWYSSPEIVGPLTQRAWVLQERLLPVRVLHVGGQQMMWECRTKVLAEGYCDSDDVAEDQKPGELESLIRDRIHNDSPSTLVSNKASMPHEADLLTISRLYSLQDNIYNQWYRVVEIYAHLRLTKRTDRLPALAGVAQQFQSLTRDTYLSGIWKSELLHGLQWSYVPSGTMTRPVIPRAPSWSWAALDRRSEKLEDSNFIFNLKATGSYKYVPYANEPSLLGYSPDLTKHGCLGGVSGSLTLLGLWRPASLGGSIDSVPERFRLSFPTTLILDSPPLYAGASLDTNEVALDTMPLGCLQLGYLDYTGPEYPAERFVSAILLQEVKASEGHGPRYVRIGLVVIPKTASLVEGWEKRSIEIL